MTAEKISSDLTGINIDTSITLAELNLVSENGNYNRKLIADISKLNTNTLALLEKLIEFKKGILNQVLTCKMYTTNYPLLIAHIINEAKMYYKLLAKIESKEGFSKDYIYEQEIFWNNIMKEHALFIRGLLDPSEDNLIQTASQFANEYDVIIKNYSNDQNLSKISLEETLKLRDFKLAGRKG